MSGYRTVLWDLDQTLLDFERSERYAISHSLSLFGMTATEEIVRLYSSINDGYWKRFERGELGRKDVLLGRFRTLFERLGVEGIDTEAFQEAYGDALGSVYYYLDDSFSLCGELKGRVRQYVVTNGVARTQRRKLELSGFAALMDGVFISEELGAPKPQNAYFDACFSLIPDFCREETLLVGDSLTSDMLGAQNAGIASCWYNPEGLPRVPEVAVDYEIRHLAQVKDILGQKGPAEGKAVR